METLIIHFVNNFYFVNTEMFNSSERNLLRMSMLAHVLFGSTLLHSFIAYFGLGYTTKGEHHMTASFLGIFLKIPSASPCSLQFLSGDSRWYGTCLGFWDIDCIPASISNPISMTFPVLSYLMFPIAWSTSLYSLINSLWISIHLFHLYI